MESLAGIVTESYHHELILNDEPILSHCILGLDGFTGIRAKPKTFYFNLVLVSSEKISLYTLVEYKTMKQVYCFNI